MVDFLGLHGYTVTVSQWMTLGKQGGTPVDVSGCLFGVPWLGPKRLVGMMTKTNATWMLLAEIAGASVDRAISHLV